MPTPQNLDGTIKEALYKMVIDPSLHRNIRKLSHIWDKLLFTPETSDSNRPFHMTRCLLSRAHTSSERGCWGTHTLCQHIITLDRYRVLHHLFGSTHCTTNGVIYGTYTVKYSIIHRPNEAILLVMVKLCLHLKIILLFTTLNHFILLIKNLMRLFPDCFQGLGKFPG